jgi:hypothetical protein
MRKLLLALVAIAGAAALSGCVTAEEMAARNARADDASCKSYGAAPGSSEYFTCRMSKDQTRTYVAQVQAEAAREQFNHGIDMMAAAAAPAPAPVVPSPMIGPAPQAHLPGMPPPPAPQVYPGQVACLTGSIC